MSVDMLNTTLNNYNVHTMQGSDTRVIPKKPTRFFGVKPVENPSNKPAPNFS